MSMSMRWNLALCVLSVVSSVVGSAAAADADGAAAYRQNCVACHGEKADGKGPAAAALRPRPTDLTQASYWAERSDEQVVATIAQVGRVPEDRTTHWPMPNSRRWLRGCGPRPAESARRDGGGAEAR